MVALAYVGAVVGAGFATGQEIYQFLSRHGTWGGVGLLVAGAAFWVLGARALELGRSGIADFGTLIATTYPPRGAAVLDRLAGLFLAAGLVVVTAAGGEALQALAGMPAPLGGLLTLILMVAVAARGSAGLLRANTLLVPILVAIAVLMALNAPGTFTGRGQSGWWVSAALYVSYNLFTGLLVLLGLGRELRSSREAWGAAAVGALVLTALGLVLHRAILAGALPAVAGPPSLPLLDVARRLGGLWPLLYGLALYAALFTTGVAEAYALFQRYGARAWGTVGLWPLSLVGFAGLVARLYPAMGVLAISFWWPLLMRNPLRGRRP
jgi:uncharacterized membrane protein YkvI